MRDFNIVESILEGEYTEPVNRLDLLQQAGNLLDHNCSGEIVGDNLFLTDDGRLIQTSVEVVIWDVSKNADENYSDQLEQSGIIKCDKCGKWHYRDKECPTVEHKSLNPVLVYMEGGLVQNIYTDKDIDVILIDGDVNDTDRYTIEIPDGKGGTHEFYASAYSTDPLAPLAEECDMKQILRKMYERDGVTD